MAHFRFCRNELSLELAGVRAGLGVARANLRRADPATRARANIRSRAASRTLDASVVAFWWEDDIAAKTLAPMPDYPIEVSLQQWA